LDSLSNQSTITANLKLWISKAMRLLMVLTILVSIQGCDKRDPKPELSDKIYIDLSTQAVSAEKKVIEAKKELEKSILDGKKISARDNHLRIINRKETSRLTALITEATQNIDYFRIRANQRAVTVRTDYLGIKESGGEWIANQSFEDYQTMKRLRTAPLDWDKRVPKSNRYSKRSPASSSSSSSTEKTAAPKSEH
jgi:uncharacterized secreted protein with C-terminal beta-propeller domain